jgi:GNAT superfamily N-acetyltransferase
LLPQNDGVTDQRRRFSADAKTGGAVFLSALQGVFREVKKPFTPPIGRKCPARSFPMSKIILRDARLEDVPAMAELLVAAWQTAYHGLIDPEYPRTLQASRFAGIFSRVLTERLETVFVAQGGTGVVGFVSGVPREEGSCDCQVIGLYVHPGHQGRGIGGRLLDRMKGHFAAQGCRRMAVWTLLGARNNAFYRGQGGRAQLHKELTIGPQRYPGVGFVFPLG